MRPYLFYCAFIDFTKAFDYVVRDNIWMKLIKLGIIKREHFKYY